MIAGANDADIGFSFARTIDDVFKPFGDQAAHNPREVYDPAKTDKVREVGTLVAMDRMMVEPARFIVRTVAAAGQPAFHYRFSYVAESMRKQWPGAPHATEIPYVFDTVEARYGKVSRRRPTRRPPWPRTFTGWRSRRPAIRMAPGVRRGPRGGARATCCSTSRRTGRRPGRTRGRRASI